MRELTRAQEIAAEYLAMKFGRVAIRDIDEDGCAELIGVTDDVERLLWVVEEDGLVVSDTNDDLIIDYYGWIHEKEHNA